MNVKIKKSKYQYENILNHFLKHNVKLLTTKSEYLMIYNSNRTKLKFICSCNQIDTKEIRNIQKNILCRFCSKKLQYESSKQTCLKKYGSEHYYQSTKFLNSRKKTWLKKYGVDNPLKSKKILNKKNRTNLDKYGFKNTFENSSIKNKIKKTCLEKYGVDWISKSPLWYPKVQVTLLKKYGVSNIGALSKQYSKVSQLLFWEIYKKLPDNLKHKTYFAELNKEFNVCYLGKYYKFDFVNSLTKKCIEFNGYNFHPKPFQKDDEINWFAFNKNKTVKEARNYEKQKYDSIEQRNYKILTIWDYEFKNDKEQTINKCIEFILK